MERKVKFFEDEYFHIFTRGVEKRKIFLDKSDRERFMALLYALNQKDLFHVSSFLSADKNDILDIYKQERGKPLVSILGYSQMPNHFHLIIKEIKEGGISKFMSKLLTAYSMYFNKRYSRSGPLFVRPFRSEHIDTDGYFRHMFAYIHLNCVGLYEKDWKINGIINKNGAHSFLEKYRYSSYPDFCKFERRNESQIIDFVNLPDFVSRAPLDISEYEKWKLPEID